MRAPELPLKQLCHQTSHRKELGVVLSISGANDYKSCCAFVEEEFKDRLEAKARQIFVYHTVATDTSNIDSVFEAAIDHVVNSNLGKAGVF